MQDYLNRALQIFVVMSAGLMAAAGADGANPPTREERDEVNKRLNKVKGSFDAKQTEVAKTQALIENLGKSIEALEKTLEPLAKVTDDGDIKAEVEKMQATLTKLKGIRTKAQSDFDKGRTNSNALKRELQTTLSEYFSKADPKMIADRFGVPFDGIDFNGTPEFMERTVGEAAGVRHYGLGAEHTWDDTFWWEDDKGNWKFSRLKAISQHEMCTTRDIYDMAKQLLSPSVPGALPPVGRAALTVNDTHLKAHPDAYKGIFGNKSFPPSVLNNSTRWSSKLHEAKEFREMMDLYTRGSKEDSVTFKVDGAEITYGLPTLGQPILCNSAGNSRWHDRPNFTMAKNYYPNRLNIGVTAIPAVKDTNRRDNKAPSEIEDYSSGCSVDAVIARPRWNKDGTPVKTQYINPKFREILEDNLWVMVGKPKPKTPKDLDDVTVYPPELVKAFYKDLDTMCQAAVANEGCDEKGLHYDLGGTSFASPTAAGVILAARIKFPDASPEEVMDAFMSSCEVIKYRKPIGEPTRDDVGYLYDKDAGWRFAPTGAGYGEFVIREGADEKNPDSWVKMQKYLQLMRDERMKITRNGKAVTEVTVGEGPDQRKVKLTGQPAHMTIELPAFSNTPTEAMTKEAKRLEDKVMAAFTDVQNYNDLSFMINDPKEIPDLIKARKYNEALAKLKTEVIDTKYVSENDPYYEAAVKAVREAENARAYTYTVNVPPNHDMALTFANLRLKFKDSDKTDNYAILESPDGRMVPITLSNPQSGFEGGTTSGFLRQSAVGKAKTGTWKIHTRQELDIEKGDCSLILAGTERNAELGIIDVRETVISKMEQAEAKARTSGPALPDKNKLAAITDPHKTLRELNGIVPSEKARKGKSSVNVPASYEEQRDYMQAVLDNSELRKAGFLPKSGTLYREGMGERPDKKGGLKTGTPSGKSLLDAALQLFNLFSSAHDMPTDDPLRNIDIMQRNWGEMALAASNGDIPSPDEPVKWKKPQVSRGFFKDLDAGADEPNALTFWQRKNRMEQIRASRQSQHGREMA